MGIVTDIQRFSIHDGPGVRTTVFLKGCPLRCKWCHNPETNEPVPQIRINYLKCRKCGTCEAVCPMHGHKILENQHHFSSYECVHCDACESVCGYGAITVLGQEMTAEEVVAQAERDIPFYGEKGGITLSGGEPFMQGKFATEILSLAKARGIDCAVQTCGHFDSRLCEWAVAYCDHIMWDIKSCSTEGYRAFTGVGNELILKNLETVAKSRSDILLRSVIMNGITDSEEHIRYLVTLAKSLHLTECPVLLSFHPFGSSKGEEVGLDCRDIMGSEFIPDKEKMNALNELKTFLWECNLSE